MQKEDINLDEFLNNINNPPSEIREKQIWYSVDYNQEFLIVDSENSEDDIFVSVMLSPLYDVYDDGVDIILDNKEFPFLAFKRIAMRFTKGPINKGQLDFYIGEINEEAFSKILNTLKITGNKYDENQMLLFEEILEDLEFLRAEAITKLEEKLDDFEEDEEQETVFIILTNSHDNETQPYIPAYALAAKNSSAVKVDYEFWEKVKNAEAVTIVDNDECVISLVELDEGLYLTFYAFKDISVKNIQIKQKENLIEATPNEIEVKTNSRTACLFPKEKLSEGKARLSFKINSKELINKDIIFER